MRRNITALVVALTTMVALAAPATATEPQFFVWRWVNCDTPGNLSVNAQIDNLSGTGYRYQVKSTFHNAAGATLRTNTTTVWIAGDTDKTVTHTVYTVDETVRTKINRGHWEYPGGWQTWVNDQQLMDVTTEAC